MKVRLKSSFYAPNGVLYEKGVQEVPDSYEFLPKERKEMKDGVNYLPRTAEKVEEDAPVKKPAAKA